MTEETVSSVFGDVDVEVETCAYCGDTHLKDDTIPIAIDARTQARDISLDGNQVHELKQAALSTLCPYCAEALFDYDGSATPVGGYPRPATLHDGYTPLLYVISVLLGSLAGLLIGSAI